MNIQVYENTQTSLRETRNPLFHLMCFGFPPPLAPGRLPKYRKDVSLVNKKHLICIYIYTYIHRRDEIFLDLVHLRSIEVRKIRLSSGPTVKPGFSCALGFSPPTSRATPPLYRFNFAFGRMIIVNLAWNRNSTQLIITIFRCTQ